MERDLQRRTRTALTRPRGPPALPVVSVSSEPADCLAKPFDFSTFLSFFTFPDLLQMEKVQRLRTEIQTLQEECTRMADEVDAKAPETRKFL